MSVVRFGDVTLGQGRVKVIVPITGASVDELMTQAATVTEHELDIVEWRADYFEDALNVDAVLAAGERIAAALKGRPLLFTFRTADEGGQQSIDPPIYQRLLTAVVASGWAAGIDVEANLDTTAGDAVLSAASAHGVTSVLSHHDFESTPPAAVMVETMVEMQQRGADVVKLAVMPQDASDVVALMAATWMVSSHHGDTPVITMAMSGLGALSRLGAQVVGSCATFASVGAASAPGQIPVDELQPILSLLDRQL